MTSERREILNHGGKAIVLHDYSNLEGEAFVKAIERNYELSTDSDNTQRLILIDATNAVVDKSVLQAMKSASSASSSKLSKTAVYGASGIQHLFLKIIGSFSKIDIRPFDTREDAMDWLVR